MGYLINRFREQARSHIALGNIRYALHPLVSTFDLLNREALLY